MKLCSEDSCGSPVLARDLCSLHYQRVRMNTPEKLQRRRSYDRGRSRAQPRVEYKLRVRYGITGGRYKEMFATQDGKCAICVAAIESAFDVTETNRNIASVDHDHTTGVVRALLCGPCNRGLGSFRDKPEVCIAAAAYLRAYKNGR